VRHKVSQTLLLLLLPALDWLPQDHLELQPLFRSLSEPHDIEFRALHLLPREALHPQSQSRHCVSLAFLVQSCRAVELLLFRLLPLFALGDPPRGHGLQQHSDQGHGSLEEAEDCCLKTTSISRSPQPPTNLTGRAPATGST